MGQLMILIKIIDDFDHNERKCWAAYQCSQWPLEPWWSGGGGDIGLVRDKYLDVQLIFKHQYHILLLILDRRLWWMFLNCISRQNMLMTLRAEHHIDDDIDEWWMMMLSMGRIVSCRQQRHRGGRQSWLAQGCACLSSSSSYSALAFNPTSPSSYIPLPCFFLSVTSRVISWPPINLALPL